MRNIIREGKTYQMSSLMQSGGAGGMHTLNMDLIHLVQQGYISRDMAESYTNSKKELSQYF